jgi:hypothetical protein
MKKVITTNRMTGRNSHKNQINHKNHSSDNSLIKFCLILLLLPASLSLSAQFYYNETCRNATGAFVPAGDAPGYTARLGIDPAGDGWLRLTNNILAFQNGYVLLNETFPSTMGVTVEFDFKIWADVIRHADYPIADGFCVFLIDGDPGKTFTIGGGGCGLGYNNLTPAYLGIAIDEAGCFSFGGAYSTGSWPDGQSARVPHAIAVRDGNYSYKGGTSANLGISTPVGYSAATGGPRPDDATIYRRVKIDIEPVNGACPLPHI